MEIELRKFDINDIKDDKVVVLIGKRETGKSYLCKDILYNHSNIIQMSLYNPNHYNLTILI